jgi:DUF1680 family protein
MIKGLMMAAVVTVSSSVQAAAPFAMRDVKLLDSPFLDNCQRHAAFLLTLEPDRLMHNMHAGCGMTPKAPLYGGWEQTGLAGHSLGHYLSALSLHYAATGDERFKQRADYIVSEMAVCQAKYGSGYIGAMGQNKERKALEALKTGDVESINHCWAPWYTQHKIIAGLLDAYTLTGNAQAKEVALGFAKWADDLTKGLSEQQVQRMLSMEFGGVGESLENLYKLTKDPAHLALARRFRHKWLLDDLAAGRDNLPGKHANTQIPKIVAEAADYEATGDEYGRRIAEYFFDTVTGSHTYATGGNSDREHFFPPETADQRMGPASVETCNVYNMLKLTRHLIAWSPTNTLYGDYYERALYNQILPSQDPDKAQFAYFMSFKPGGFHVYSTPDDSFWCCYGTGLENHTKFNDSIYFHDDQNLYVNLFIPSVLTWKEKGLVLTQTTDYPKNGKVALRFDAAPASAVVLNVRCPGWAAGNVVFMLNGKVVAEGKPGTCAKLAAAWKKGDVLSLDIPMELRYEPLLGRHKEYVAFFHGPTLLAGDFGVVPDYADRLYVRSQLDLQNEAGKPVPVLEAESIDEVMASLKPVSGEDRAFMLAGVTRPEETVTLRPFNQMPYNYYNVYWHVLTPEQWEAKKRELAEEEVRRKALEARVVDQIAFGEQQPEIDHALQGEKTRTGIFNQRRWRDAADGGWFEFRMKVDPGQPQVLMCTYWGDDVGREFEILVDGTEIASQKLEHNQPGKFFDAEYPLPAELLAGKETITVRLESTKRTLVGGLFGCAVLRSTTE